MLWFGILGALVVYIVGVMLTLDLLTVEKTEYHEGGFLDMGYASEEHRMPKRKDRLLALAFPVLLLYDLCKGLLECICGIILFFWAIIKPGAANE